jgi:C-terminal processing protease CtpA/Prc
LSQEAIAYLNEVLDLLEQHSVRRKIIDWERLRGNMLALAENAHSIPEIYPVIRKALASLGDHHSFFVSPNEVSRFEEGALKNVGILAIYSEGTVVGVGEGSPAERAGVQIGDVLETINRTEIAAIGAEAFKDALQESSSVTLTLKRVGQVQPYTVVLEATRYPIVAKPQGRRFAPEIGYVDLPGIVGSDELLYEYAATLQELIRLLDQVPVRGWVVDLRRDTGGNMLPMLTGLGPLLGEGGLGAFVDQAGATIPWVCRDGQIWIGDWAWKKLDHPYIPRDPDVPVAILTSRLTASSGELVLLAFRGRVHTRTFGEETAGVPTGNQGTKLSDGAMVQLTVALGTDRTGRIYDAPVMPDEHVEADWSELGTEKDPVLVAAIDWLRDESR